MCGDFCVFVNQSLTTRMVKTLCAPENTWWGNACQCNLPDQMFFCPSVRLSCLSLSCTQKTLQLTQFACKRFAKCCFPKLYSYVRCFHRLGFLTCCVKTRTIRSAKQLLALMSVEGLTYVQGAKRYNNFIS